MIQALRHRLAPALLTLGIVLGAPVPIAAAERERGEVADALPWGASIEAGLGISSVPMHGRVGLGLGRMVANRLSVEAVVRLGVGENFLLIEPVLRLGLVFRVAERWELGFSYVFGYAQFRYTLPAGTLWVGSFVFGIRNEARWRLSRRWELRIPLFPLIIYPNEAWGVVFDPTAILAFRF